MAQREIIALNEATPQLEAAQSGDTYLAPRDITMSSTVSLNWNEDAYVYRDAANTLALRNGANAQEFRVYNTYTDASNYERGFLRWRSSDFVLGIEGAGTGSDLRFLALEAEGVEIRSRAGAVGARIEAAGGNIVDWYLGSTSYYRFNTSIGFQIHPNTGLGWGSTNATSSMDTKLNRSSAGVVGVTNALLVGETAGYTVATLPTAAVGMIARVTDADTPSIGSTVTGGGADAALVWYNGTNWTVIGV